MYIPFFKGTLVLESRNVKDLHLNFVYLFLTIIYQNGFVERYLVTSIGLSSATMLLTVPLFRVEDSAYLCQLFSVEHLNMGLL